MSKGGWQKGKVSGAGEVLTHEETLAALRDGSERLSDRRRRARRECAWTRAKRTRTSWIPNSTGSCVAMIERRHRSVYEDRELGWRDRLRRLFGHEDERQEPLLDEWGDPTLVVVKGEPVGIRDTKGGSSSFHPILLSGHLQCGRTSAKTGGFDLGGGTGGASGAASTRARVGLPLPRLPPLVGLSLPLPPPHLAAFP